MSKKKVTKKEKVKDESYVHAMRHSMAHIMAEAVQDMFPEVQFGIGPVIENGFYYDFDLPRTLIPEDLKLIEKKMKHIVKQRNPFTKEMISKQEALAFFDKADEPYKKELIEELADGEISLYKSGKFVDLCKGPHLDHTGEAGAFKLTHISGAYWRGDEHNKMLQRIYGVAFATQEELDEYLKMVEEAKKRDHRKLGKQLDLFTFSPLVGPGLPLFTPRGTIIIDELQKHIENICRDYGFDKVKTPHLAKIDLYKLSGHADKFSDELFHVTSKHKQDYVMKPVQCPHQTQIYASQHRSYRDLPIRYMESEKQYRAEKPGEIGGLSRVIAITVEDGHSFCTVEQVKDEVVGMVNIIKEFYTALGLWKELKVYLSVRDYEHPDKYIGTPEDWDMCESMLEDVCKELKLDAVRQEGEAALYGPKIDFMFKDSLGKEIQIPTVQLDFATPKRFDLKYINSDGQEVPPVMVHRAVLGSYERFLVILIEHFAGVFPLWLAPEQVRIIPVSTEKHSEYANKIKAELEKKEFRVTVDDAVESVGKKIRNAELMKVNYMIIVGDKDVEADTVSVRPLQGEDLGAMKLPDFVKIIKKERDNKEIKQ